MSQINVNDETDTEVTEPTTAPEVTATEDTSTPAPEAPAVAAAPKVKKKLNMTYLSFAIEGIMLVAIVLLALQLTHAQNDKKQLASQLAGIRANPQALVQKQTDDLLGSVGKLMTLPAGETPTIAAVTDAAAAKQQSPFFANAQNGDKVLMYVKAGEAILYRPSTDKIILVAPLTFDQSTASTNKTTTTTPTTTTTTKR